MLLIQWIGGIIFLYLIVVTLVNIIKRKISPGEGALWEAIWLLLFVSILAPSTTTDLGKMLGIGRGVDVVIYLMIFLLLCVDFYLITRVESMEKNITKIVREIALKGLKKRKKK